MQRSLLWSMLFVNYEAHLHATIYRLSLQLCHPPSAEHPDCVASYFDRFWPKATLQHVRLLKIDKGHKYAREMYRPSTATGRNLSFEASGEWPLDTEVLPAATHRPDLPCAPVLNQAAMRRLPVVRLCVVTNGSVPPWGRELSIQRKH